MKLLWLADKPDKNAIERKQSEMEAIGHKLRGIWTDFHLQLHAVLTPEQRAKWPSTWAGGRHGRGAGHGRGSRHGARRDAWRWHGRGMGGGCPCGDHDFPYSGE